jgi:hypothetical protein
MVFSPTCVILAPVLISISNTGIWIGDMVICTMTHGNELANSLEIRHANLGIRMSSRQVAGIGGEIAMSAGEITDWHAPGEAQGSC